MTYRFAHITILLVEDNQAMLGLIRAVLQSFGVGNIVTALNGDDAFAAYCRHNPDLIITDWMMEPCDGIALSRRIRNDPKSPNQFVPIILMTGFSEKGRVFHARDAGITEFLVKPFNTRDLYKRLYQLIEKPRQFVRNEGFFGPDRRRKALDGYDGTLKRQDDNKSEKVRIEIPVTEIDFE